MNEMVLSAWDDFVSDKKTTDIVLRSFKVSNSFPLNDPLGMELGEQQNVAGSDENFAAARGSSTNSDFYHYSFDGDQLSDKDDDCDDIDDDDSEEEKEVKDFVARDRIVGKG